MLHQIFSQHQNSYFWYHFRECRLAPLICQSNQCAHCTVSISSLSLLCLGTVTSPTHAEELKSGKTQSLHDTSSSNVQSEMTFHPPLRLPLACNTEFSDKQYVSGWHCARQMMSYEDKCVTANVSSEMRNGSKWGILCGGEHAVISSRINGSHSFL